MTTATGMCERPILLSDAMICAILEGRKTVTRRVVKPQPEPSHPNHWIHGAEYVPEFKRWLWEEYWESYDNCGRGSDFLSPDFGCPYGAAGDRLWVRESFNRCGCGACEAAWPTKPAPDSIGSVHYPAYRATHKGPSGYCWRPSIHMPRWASRITLEVTNVRVERVQDITPEDVFAEGVQIPVNADTGGALLSLRANGPVRYLPSGFFSAGFDETDFVRAHFAALWDALNEKRGYGWDVNPWCWRIEFRVLEMKRA